MNSRCTFSIFSNTGHSYENTVGNINIYMKFIYFTYVSAYGSTFFKYVAGLKLFPLSVEI